MRIDPSLVFYAVGSVCFLVGTLIQIVRSL
jgi:hypothetical protein